MKLVKKRNRVQFSVLTHMQIRGLSAGEQAPQGEATTKFWATCNQPTQTCKAA